MNILGKLMSSIAYPFDRVMAKYADVRGYSVPRRYPKTYFDQKLYWNEQYLLQALLTFNSRFEVLWAGNHLMLEYPERMYAHFPEISAMRAKFPSSEPSSFWMRVKEAP